jgi:hypothetical protein
LSAEPTEEEVAKALLVKSQYWDAKKGMLIALTAFLRRRSQP